MFKTVFKTFASLRFGCMVTRILLEALFCLYNNNYYNYYFFPSGSYHFLLSIHFILSFMFCCGLYSSFWFQSFYFVLCQLISYFISFFLFFFISSSFLSFFLSSSLSKCPFALRSIGRVCIYRVISLAFCFILET